MIYDPAEIARAGVFVSIDGDGDLRIERGYVRPEDEAPAEPDADGDAPEGSEDDGDVQRTVITIGGDGSSADAETAEEEDGIKPLPDRLVTELTAHRTLALRDALANDPDTAFARGAPRALPQRLLSLRARRPAWRSRRRAPSFGTQAPGLNDSASAKAIEDRHAQWAGQLPKDAGDLWNALIAFDGDSRAALFAHCASLSVNAVHEPWNRNPRRIAHADQLARAVGLDMVAAGWTPTVDNYLGRVTKARILEAVREAKGEASAQLIDHLKKPDMAKEAERLLAGSGWLPEPLRTARAPRRPSTNRPRPKICPPSSMTTRAPPRTPIRRAAAARHRGGMTSTSGAALAAPHPLTPSPAS